MNRKAIKRRGVNRIRYDANYLALPNGPRQGTRIMGAGFAVASTVPASPPAHADCFRLPAYVEDVFFKDDDAASGNKFNAAMIRQKGYIWFISFQAGRVLLLRAHADRAVTSGGAGR